MDLHFSLRIPSQGKGFLTECMRGARSYDRTFSWPKPSEGHGGKLKLAPEALALLTGGIDLKGARMRPWYESD